MRRTRTRSPVLKHCSVVFSQRGSRTARLAATLGQPRSAWRATSSRHAGGKHTSSTCRAWHQRVTERDGSVAMVTSGGLSSVHKHAYIPRPSSRYRRICLVWRECPIRACHTVCFFDTTLASRQKNSETIHVVDCVEYYSSCAEQNVPVVQHNPGVCYDRMLTDRSITEMMDQAPSALTVAHKLHGLSIPRRVIAYPCVLALVLGTTVTSSRACILLWYIA